MKRNVLFGIILSGSSLTTFAQLSHNQRYITITPHIAIQNFDWMERSTVGSAGVQVQFQPNKKLNLTIDGNVFNSLGNSINLNNNVSTSSSVDNNGRFGAAYGGPTGISGAGSSGLPKTIYQGAFINIDAGIPIKLGDSSRTIIEPFVGIEGKI